MSAIKKILEDMKFSNKDFILMENAKDILAGSNSGMSVALIDRLRLSDDRIAQIAAGLRQITELPDPTGVVLETFERPNGLKIQKCKVPMGVIGIIYEARPNVTADAAGLCLKSGNAVILKGGSEAMESNKAIAKVLAKAAEANGMPEGCIQFVDTADRQAVSDLIHMNGLVDIVIPRGGAGLIKMVVMNATVPVIETGAGNCHVFVDASADPDMAVNITDNAKTQRPSVCNAIENLLVHKDIAEKFLPMMAERFKEHNVRIYGCDRTREILGDGIEKATEVEYETEFLDYTIAVKVVEDVKEAVEHIRKYSTKHSECIVTKSLENAEYFQRCVDAAAVYVNASTRFTDGNVFGLGAEIGISTQKLHARGPMGLTELTTVKYLINGNGQIR